MDIRTAHDARAWIESWIADRGRVRPGVLIATRDGLETVIAIMDGAAARYSASTRDDARAALAVLTDEVDDDGYPRSGGA